MRGSLLLLACIGVGCAERQASDDDAGPAVASVGAGGQAGQGGSGGAGGSGPMVPPGCERTAATPGMVQALTIDVNGTLRNYRLYTPTTAACDNPSGILFFFHGLGGSENNFNAIDPLAESQNLLFVQPRGSPQSWAGGSLGWVPDGFAENVALLRAIRTQLEQAYAVDGYHVFVAGFSQGAFMSAALASPNALGNEVTGVGIFGGGDEANTCPSMTCYATLACKIPFFMRTGASDQHLPYTETLYDGLVASGWAPEQLDFQTFPGGHTIRIEDITAMLGWFGGAYPHL
jgi:predicted esterase